MIHSSGTDLSKGTDCETESTTRTRIATPRDLSFIRSAARTATESIGFLPTPKLEVLLRQRQVAVVLANGDRVGFVVHGRTPPVIKIWQLWVQDDARRIEYGTALVQHVMRTSTKHDAYAISLRCATDLPAIAFWNELRFRCFSVRKGGTKRHRQIALLHRQLTPLERLGLNRLPNGA